MSADSVLQHRPCEFCPYPATAQIYLAEEILQVCHQHLFVIVRGCKEIREVIDAP